MKSAAKSRPVIACIASQLVKDGHPQLGLAQRAISYFCMVMVQASRYVVMVNISFSFSFCC